MNKELAEFWESLKRALSAAADLMVLNILLILCCIPVITAGAAWAAGYFCLLRIVRGEEQGFPFRPFFEEFKKTFRKATPAWLLLLVCLAILAGDYYYAVYFGGPANKLFLVFSVVMAFVLLAAATWLFPLLARYENTLGKHIRNSFLMAVAEFPKTLGAMAVQGIFLLLPLLFPDLFAYFGWIYVMFGFSLPMYITVYLFRKRLECIPKAKNIDGQD
jgi:uncharacterized membrane protein YesL